MHTHVGLCSDPSASSAGALAPENVAFRAKLGFLAALIAAMCGPAIALAEPQPTPTPTSTPNSLGTITVHAGAREGYTIPVAELRRLGAVTVGDALRFVPGAAIQQYGPPGSLQTVALRGATASQTLVLMDGRPLNEAETGVADLTSLPLDDLEYISVSEGGLSSLYGSAAVGGIINLVRKSALQGHAVAGSVQVGYQGAFSQTVSALAGTSTPGLGVFFDASTRRASNVFDYPAFGSIAGGTRTNNDLSATDTNLTLRGLHGPFRVSLSLENNASDLGVPGSTEFGTDFISKLARQQRIVNRAAATLEYSENGSNTTGLDAYVDGRRVHFFDPSPSFPFDTLTLVTSRGFSLSHSARLGSRHLVKVAYEGRGNRALFEGTFNSPPSVVVGDASTDYYLRDEYRASDALRIGAGIRTERNQGTKATSLPSVDVEWAFPGSGDSGIRASYARAFRAPNLDERFFPGFGNPKLEPEYAATFDVGFFANSGSVVRNAASVTFFGLDTNNLIDNEAIDKLGDFLPFNVGRSRVRGVSAQETRQFLGGWVAQATYTNYFKAADLSLTPDLNGVVNYGNRLERRPLATSSLEAWRMTGDDEYGFDLRFVGQRFGDEENLHSLPAYAALGAHVSKALGRHLLLTVRGDNLTNQQVMEVYGFPTMRGTYAIRLSTR
ncbi:MAG TPA: TonB-dependent receptor [Candidatus Tumulicola sp.]|nr:TonB-dependent receptor [Candidatus Tumulicola sp.]